jgi:hypothetical protein
MSQRRHRVYIVTLKRTVAAAKRFRQKNPDYIPGRPCVYVGMTGLSVEVRLAQHKAGYKAGRKWVTRFGKKLRVSEMRRLRLRAMSYEGACKAEVETAAKLRARGWGVLQG